MTRLIAVPTVALLALALPSVAHAQDPAAPDPATAGASADVGVTAEATPPAEATKDEAAAGDASDGRAGDPLPIAQAARPLVLPHMMLSPGLTMTFFHFDFGFASDTAVIMGVDAKLGLGDIAEVEFSPFTSALSPSFEYGATVGGTVRLVDTELLELGPRLRMLFTTDGIAISPGLPVRLHASDMFRIDTGVYVGILTSNFASGGDTTVGLSSIGTSPLTITPGIPLEVTINPIPEVFVGAGTGFGIFNFKEAGDSIFVPLGINAGGTIPVDDHPLVDIGVGFGFPYFIGTLPGADTIITELWQVNVGARANLDLAEMMGQ